MKKNNHITILLALGFSALLQAQPNTNKKDSQYQFTITKSIDAAPVQNQGKTGTCWSFSTLSFFESEVMRVKKTKEVKLSEMFVVRKTYPLKAQNYIRMHGSAQFAEGGEPTDVVYCWKNFGMMPREIYNGNYNEATGYNHHNMDSVLLAEIKSFTTKSQIQAHEWKEQIEGTLSSYLGNPPETFTYKGKSYTPKSYAAELGINPDDYVFISSFTHHPFYKPFILEVPDNWAWKSYQNIPIDEVIQTINHALSNGYGVAWAADVSEPYFRFKEGLALVPDAWESMSAEAKNACFTTPCKQQTITQELRQEKFDNYETQDDHGMHIIGMAKDQNGGNYYVIKNSWGTKRNDCDGYFYASEAYVRLKTVSITLHKKAIPAEIAKKMSVK
ncbi:MAG: aminopeptidase [Bacteroidetes bacterium]|nr:aminopeptidase [Bacteroidota bacterium]